MLKEYTNVEELSGPLMIVDGVEGIAYDELVEIEMHNGENRLGQVLEAQEGRAVVQIYGGTSNMKISGGK